MSPARTFEHLKRWKLPRDYMGASWPEMFVFLGQHRDSDSLSRSNFAVGLASLGGESETVQVVRESHWAVGWVEWIGVREDDAERLALAESMLAAIADYPCLDEEHWSELEWNEASEYWQRCSIRERLDIIKSSGSCASPFAARRAELPEDNGDVGQWLARS